MSIQSQVVIPEKPPVGSRGLCYMVLAHERWNGILATYVDGSNEASISANTQ